jgi:hypothetical protein
MRVVWVTLAVASAGLTLGLVSAGGCGLGTIGSPLDPGADGGPFISGAPHDSGKDLVPEPGATPDGAELDAAADAWSDFTADAGPCPNECSSCVGAVCEIECPGEKCHQTITCPDKFSCRVNCAENGACSGTTIKCAADKWCSLHCAKNGACATVSVNAAWVSNFCVQCNEANSCAGIGCSTLGWKCSHACGAANDTGCTGLSDCGFCGSTDTCP